MDTDADHRRVSDSASPMRPHLDRLLEHACARHVRVEEARILYGRDALLAEFEVAYEAWLSGRDLDDVLAARDLSELEESAVRLLVQFACDPDVG